MTTLEKLTDAELKMKEAIGDYNKALEEGKLDAMADAEHEVKERAKKYAGLAQTAFFESVSDKEDYNGTILRAVKELTYKTKWYRINKDEETITGMEMTEKSVMVDLRKLCRHNGFEKAWIHTLEKFNLLLTLRAATELCGVDKDATDAQREEFKRVLQTINDSFYMKEKAKEIELGKTPTSKTQLCRQLQAVIDKILFVATDKNSDKNLYAANSHDVAYLLMCYTKRGKSALKVVCSKHSFVERLVTEILHRVITGGVYDVEYQVVKPKK